MLSRLLIISLLCFPAYSFLGFNVRGNAPWFQNGLNFNPNRIRDTFMNGVLRGKNSRCNGTDSFALAEGVCKPQKECRKEGGTPSGTCALVGACCIQSATCGNSTNSRVAYFTNPTVFQPTCSLTVRLASPNVCQIRLDFDQFEIADPAGALENMAVTTAADCINDTFTVTGSSTTDLGFKALCGVNNGQHIYIPVNASMSNAIILNFALNAIRVQNPNWKIKITQLECEGAPQDFSSVQSALTNMYQKHKNKKNNIRTDQNLIAPPGCLQYFPQPTGSYESFNYKNGQGRMIANTNYAVCFRRQMNTCGIQHNARTFVVADQASTGLCRDEAGNGDWLFIPGVSVISSTAQPTTPQTHQDYLCGTDLDQPVTSGTAGPIFVGVRTDGLPDSDVNFALGESGFRIDYMTLTTNCVSSTVPTTTTTTPLPPAPVPPIFG